MQSVGLVCGAVCMYVHCYVLDLGLFHFFMRPYTGPEEEGKGRRQKKGKKEEEKKKRERLEVRPLAKAYVQIDPPVLQVARDFSPLLAMNGRVYPPYILSRRPPVKLPSMRSLGAQTATLCQSAVLPRWPSRPGVLRRWLFQRRGPP